MHCITFFEQNNAPSKEGAKVKLYILRGEE